MNLRLNGKVAVITGGGSGIGRASALRFLDEGASVVVSDLNQANGESVVQLADERGHKNRIRFIRSDVSQEADVAAMMELAVNSFGKLDCVFNNAGIPGVLGPLREIKVEDWDFTFGVLVRGAFLGIKHAIPVFKRQGTGGVIINTASVAGMVGGSGPRAYSVAKAAVIHLTTVAALELAPDRVRVNAICPGAILTAIGGKDEKAAIERLSQAQPWPDHGTSEDIAATAAFLTSDDARFITGHAMVVDGGMLASGSNAEGKLGRGGWSEISGMHHGTTGVKAELRRL